ncbi:SNF2 super family [Micromonas pusilla CCMP1545]|uniref:SNF2 super family n=1 Tax=Micromonas pusilla (strain CCMP1545) TaxID=564608 RepID=C1N5H4_MICPC|nr:SNF2 super family [Micromonas pusilla CCMP1545]EEH52499.1 SNF2 super family [Micromonas pusilla CCMP1545]|eukprot:XP_003063363.1 SNF2 super family [Micromonas pusilla CCMP1545]
MVKRLPELKDLVKAIGRPLRVATMCSGTESPLLALDKIGAATGQIYDAPLGVDHVFSCEIEPFKQAYIERNFAPPILFRDIRELDGDQATTAYGALVDVPGNVDMLVAGTSCVDYSNLNNEKKDIDEAGESGQTFRGMMTWIKKHEPPIVILENVCGAPWDKIAERFRQQGYQADYTRLDTKRYYIPHTRTRVYLVAWIARVKSLERGASATLEAFLFDSDDPRVHKGRQMLALPGEATSQRGVTDWGRCESRHRRARKDEGLGNRRPFTDWEGGCTLPDYAWNDWGKAQTDRVLDLMDIDYLRLAQSGTDSMHKTLVWNLSQNVDRTTGSGAAGICPCLTPSMVPFVTNRGGPLVGIEALSLQGIPVDDLLLTRESEGQMSDLAGNAMTTTVVGACMLSALLLMKDELVEHTKKVNAKLKAEAKTKESEARKAGGGSKTLAKSAAALSVGGAAGSVAAASTVEGADDLKEEDLVLCCATDRKEHTSDILDRAHRSARLCVCEAQTGSRDAIYRCEDCGHTACADCKGRPEHNYKRHDIERIAPDVFSAHLKQTLPMRVKLSGLNVAAEKKMVDDAKATWVAFAEALETIAGADFMFREVKRADVWTARYVCPSTDEVVLELRLGRTVAQSDWRVVITNEETGEKELKEFAPHPVYQWPLARMRLAPGASHLLDGVWDVLAPIEHAFDVAIEGKGEKKKNWQTELGMIGNDDPERLDISLPDGVDSNRAPWSDLRWSEYVVTTLKTDGMTAKEFEQQKESFPVDGTYALHDKCGTAMASLHKRVDPKPTLNKSAEAYFFLDPVRNSDGKEDFFVFADNHRRLQYGEHRMHAARVHHSFRPSDAKGKETFACRTDGRWMKSDEVNLIQLDEKRAAKQGVPKNAKALSSRAGGCQAAVAIMKAKVPLAEVDASAWPEDEFETLQNDRSSEVFQRLAWFTSRLALPSEVRSFTTLDEKRLNSNACGGAKCPEACPRCAPSPPVLQWTCKAGESKITAREDPRQAAAYEQALKRRPAPFVVQWRKTAAAAGKKLGELVIAVNPATLAHRALANVYSGVAKERSAAPQAEDKPTVEWQVVKHEEREAAVALADFTLKSNRSDAKAPQPKGWNTKFPLRPEQLRSLGWMIRQEQTTEPFVEEEVAESVHPALGLRMDGRARVERLVRGGIIADQVGYGKTAITIGAILASEIKFPLPNAMAKPVNAIPTKATLVLAPSQLLKQWPREVEKFSAEGRLVTLVIRTVADISHYTVQDFQRADVVICATSVLRSPLYFERLARLAGVASLPQCKAAGAGRHFAASYRDCLDKLETQCERLTSGPNGVVECAANSPAPAAAAATSPRARLARASASKPIKYADDGDDFGSDFESDSDSSEYDEVDEEEEERKAKAKAAAKRRAAACAKGKKSKSPASASASPDEADESADKDHWGFETTSVERDWTKTSSCPLELFHWRRVVVDEFTYLQQSDRCVVLGLKAEARWCLSGTPPVGAFSEIKDTAALLGTNLGSDEMPRYTKAEITKAESFQFFKEKPTQHWHATRHAVAQGFLDRFVRQNIAEIDEIKSVTDLNLLNLRPVEKAIYLELEHYLKSTDMMVKTKKKKSSDGDRDKRMAKVLEGSASGAEALVKCVTKFKLDNDAGAGTGACNAIVRVREEEKEDCERNIVRAVLDAKVMFWEAKEMARELGVDVIDTPSSRAPSKTAAKSYEDMTKNQQKAYRKPVDDKMWQLRDHTHDVNALVNELSGRTRALRFFKAVRELQGLRDDDAIVCQACEANECGHVGCLACLRADANLQECGVPGCARACGGDNIITAASLGTEREGCVDGDAALASPTKKKRGGGNGGNGGDRTAGGGSIVMSELVQSLRGFNPDERVLIFIQYPDLMKQVSDVLDDANIKYLKLKGSVHQQCAALDEFQKEKLRPGDARVLMLLSRDESASGANLTTANHAIFVHPLETNTQYEYDASETQAIGRIRRYGQTKLVHVHRLIAKDTIEEKIYNERGGEMFKGTHVK